MFLIYSASNSTPQSQTPSRLRRTSPIAARRGRLQLPYFASQNRGGVSALVSLCEMIWKPRNLGS